MPSLVFDNQTSPFTDIFGDVRGRGHMSAAMKKGLLPETLTAEQVLFLARAESGDLQFNGSFFARALFKFSVERLSLECGTHLVDLGLLKLPNTSFSAYNTRVEITDIGLAELKDAELSWAPRQWSPDVIVDAAYENAQKYAISRLRDYERNVLGAPDKGQEVPFYMKVAQNHAYAFAVHEITGAPLMGSDWLKNGPVQFFVKTPNGEAFGVDGYQPMSKHKDARELSWQQLDFIVASRAYQPMEMALARHHAAEMGLDAQDPRELHFR